MEISVQSVIQFLADHPLWAAVGTFTVAFGESLMIVSFAFPGMAIVVVAGALVSIGDLPVLPFLIGGVLGAIAGDGVSYWTGRRFGNAANHVWPLDRNADLVSLGAWFFEHHGGAGIVIGRFFGPLRATVPLAAGILQMRGGQFWVANVLSAIVWAPWVLLQGAILGALIKRSGSYEGLLTLTIVFLVAFAIVGASVAVSRRRTPKPTCL
jgi:membrane protein DedA with SNARE-associated domain